MPSIASEIPAGTLTALTLTGFENITGTLVRAIWDPAGDDGRGAGLIGIRRGDRKDISWYPIPSRHIFIPDGIAYIIELRNITGIVGSYDNRRRGIVISDSDFDRLRRFARADERYFRAQIYFGVPIFTAPDWTFDPLAIAQARFIAGMRIAVVRPLTAVIEQIIDTITRTVDRIVERLTRKDRL